MRVTWLPSYTIEAMGDPWRFGDGVEEDGVRWDVVRSDLCHALGEVIHNGALARDLHAAKDSKGRDPAVSYGDVQLQRHLERFQKLALAGGWPIFEVLYLVADLSEPSRRLSQLGIATGSAGRAERRRDHDRVQALLVPRIPERPWFKVGNRCIKPRLRELELWSSHVKSCQVHDVCLQFSHREKNHTFRWFSLEADMGDMGISGHGLTTVFGRKHAAPLLRQTCPLARSAANAALAAAGMRVNGGRLQIGMSPGQESVIWVQADAGLLIFHLEFNLNFLWATSEAKELNIGAPRAKQVLTSDSWRRRRRPRAWLPGVTAVAPRRWVLPGAAGFQLVLKPSHERHEIL
eukprot:Skav236577  [mRNA]  locus=scaffold2180:283108:287991:- [translate_table: standard]